MVERIGQKLRFSHWDLDEIRYLKALGYSGAGIGAIVGCSDQQANNLIKKHGLDAPLGFSETTLLGCWSNWRDLQRRRLRPDLTDEQAVFLAEKCVRIAAEIRRLEAFQIGTQSAVAPAEPSLFEDFERMSFDEKRAFLGELVERAD